MFFLCIVKTKCIPCLKIYLLPSRILHKTAPTLRRFRPKLHSHPIFTLYFDSPHPLYTALYAPTAHIITYHFDANFAKILIPFASWIGQKYTCSRGRCIGTAFFLRIGLKIVYETCF